MQVVDFPASVGHACSFLDATVEIQLGVTSERVGLQHASEVREMLLGMFTTSIRRIGEPDRRRLLGSA